jgi:hypothetical protein
LEEAKAESPEISEVGSIFLLSSPPLKLSIIPWAYFFGNGCYFLILQGFEPSEIEVLHLGFVFSGLNRSGF